MSCPPISSVVEHYIRWKIELCGGCVCNDSLEDLQNLMYIASTIKKKYPPSFCLTPYKKANMLTFL
jgi:hypothetical protein